MKEKCIFAGSGIVRHGEKIMAEFNDNFLLKTDDPHLISTLRKRGYRQIQEDELQNFLKYPQIYLRQTVLRLPETVDMKTLLKESDKRKITKKEQ